MVRYGKTLKNVIASLILQLKNPITYQTSNADT